MQRQYKSNTTGRRKGNGGEWERLQLYRLLCVLVLFLVVFVGKRVCPGRVIAAGERVMEILNRNMDIEAVFSRLGDSIAGETGVLEGLEDFCIEVFGDGVVESEREAEKAMCPVPVCPDIYTGLLSDQLGEIRVYDVKLINLPDEEVEPAAVGTILITAEPSEHALPDGYTADKLSFGALETVAPVPGQLTSAFGYRKHPINGTYCFHAGADIDAREGDPIGAFADGVVEYIGEDNSYGRYLQLDHGEGIKSFYAHCQRLCVEKGQSVSAGETVATVGATGTATGPHLHLELKCCGLRVDPAYYVEQL